MSDAPRSEKIWFDGQLVGWDQATVHVLAHTLHYGMGVFEGIRCYETDKGPAVFRLKEHVDRLFDSAKIIGIEIPFANERIYEAIKETILVNGLDEGYIRPLVFLGDNRRGLNCTGATVHVAVAVWPWGAYLGEEALAKGIRVKVSSFTRHHENIFMTKAKVCGAYVNSIMAKLGAHENWRNLSLHYFYSEDELSAIPRGPDFGHVSADRSHKSQPPPGA